MYKFQQIMMKKRSVGGITFDNFLQHRQNVDTESNHDYFNFFLVSRYFTRQKITTKYRSMMLHTTL